MATGIRCAVWRRYGIGRLTYKTRHETCDNSTRNIQGIMWRHLLWAPKLQLVQLLSHLKTAISGLSWGNKTDRPFATSRAFHFSHVPVAVERDDQKSGKVNTCGYCLGKIDRKIARLSCSNSARISALIGRAVSPSFGQSAERDMRSWYWVSNGHEERIRVSSGLSRHLCSTRPHGRCRASDDTRTRQALSRRRRLHCAPFHMMNSSPA